MLEKTSFECFSPTLHPENDDCDNDAQQDYRKSNDQAVHILVIVEELRDLFITARQNSSAGIKGADKESDYGVSTECGHLYLIIDIKSWPA